MITLLGAFLGLLGPILPELLGWLKAKQEFAFKLSMAELQMKTAAAGHEFRMEQINAEADISEVKALHDEFAKRQATWKWVEALISSVRPILTYSFFGLYAAVKWSQIVLALRSTGNDLSIALPAVWHDQDMAIFATIIAFWFGNRAMQKFRLGK